MNEKNLESTFESLLHKTNFVRKFFAERRFERGKARLIYQPMALREACRKFSIDVLMDAINEALSQRRGNYFAAFLQILGEDLETGGWRMYELQN